MTKTEAKLAGLQILDNYRSLIQGERLKVGDTVFVSVMPELLIDGPYRIARLTFEKIVIEPEYLTNDSFPVAVNRASIFKELEDDD